MCYYIINDGEWDMLVLICDELSNEIELEKIYSKTFYEKIPEIKMCSLNVNQEHNEFIKNLTEKGFSDDERASSL